MNYHARPGGGKYLLAIDIGNTNITAGLFMDGVLCKKAKIPAMRYSAYAANFKKILPVDGGVFKGEVIISSVAPLILSRLLVFLNKTGHFNIIILGKDKFVPIRNLYRIKNEVGIDRLVNAFAAKSIYGAPAVIVDFGTAITFDVISGKGEYLGGLILPGIGMSLCGLYEKTALLPRVELKPARDIIGKDTVGSMRGGILFGFGAMCDGLISRYRKILGKNLKVIATGGNSSLMKKYAKSIQKVDEDLTLKGLYLTSKKI